jgi:hypothetical protein
MGILLPVLVACRRRSVDSFGIGADDLLHRPDRHQPAVIQPDRLIAQRFQSFEGIGNARDRLSRAPELQHSAQASKDSLVANSQHLVDDRDIRIHTRFTSAALSTIDVVPLIQASVKKL